MCDRFLVVLKFGGLYADADVECRKPLDQVIKPLDTLVAGWQVDRERKKTGTSQSQERLLSHVGDDLSSETARLVDWSFAAAPSHPVIKRVCDDLAAQALAFRTAAYAHNLQLNIPLKEAVIDHALKRLPGTQVRV
jgi:mannosyltransferase OCH1-like enzyme